MKFGIAIEEKPIGNEFVEEKALKYGAACIGYDYGMQVTNSDGTKTPVVCLYFEGSDESFEKAKKDDVISKFEIHMD